MRNARILHEWSHAGERWAFFVAETIPSPAMNEMVGHQLFGQPPPEPQPEQQGFGVCKWSKDPFGNGHWAPTGEDPQTVANAVFTEFQRLIMVNVVGAGP